MLAGTRRYSALRELPSGAGGGTTDVFHTKVPVISSNQWERSAPLRAQSHSKTPARRARSVLKGSRDRDRHVQRGAWVSPLSHELGTSRRAVRERPCRRAGQTTLVIRISTRTPGSAPRRS